MEYFTLWGFSSTKLMPARDKFRQLAKHTALFLVPGLHDDGTRGFLSEQKPWNTTGFKWVISAEDRKKTDNKTASGEKPAHLHDDDACGLLGEQDPWNTTGSEWINFAEDRKQTKNKTTIGEKPRYEPIHVRGFCDELYPWNTAAQASIKSIEDKKQTEEKTRSRVKPTNTPRDEKEKEVWAEPSSRNIPEIKSTEYPKQTKKKTPSKEVLNDVTPFFKWILLLFFCRIPMASATATTASTQILATNPIQTFNVTKGTNVTIRFDNLESHPPAVPYLELSYESENMPFCCGSQYTLLNAGFRAQDQEGRFFVEGLRASNTFSVFLNISDVSVKDGGRIELVLRLRNQLGDRYVTRTAIINVRIPPAKAKCNFSREAIIGHQYHVVRCQAPAENGKVTLSCFRSNSKIIPIDIIANNNDMIRGTFWAKFGDWVQCCSHLTTDDVTQETCNDSIFQHPQFITTSISNLYSRPTTDISSTNSSDPVCVLMSWIPLYLLVIISLSSLTFSEFSLNMLSI